MKGVKVWVVAGWWLLTLGLGLIRATFLLRMTISNPVVILFGLFDFAAIALGTWNLLRAKHRHYSVSSLAVPVLYLLGLMLLPRMQSVQFAGVSAGLVLIGPCLTGLSLLALRGRFTYGGTTWVSLCDKGLYRWVRHPQQAGRMVFCLGVLVATGSPWALVCGLLGALVAVFEERDLVAYPEYVEYRKKVKWWFIPGRI